jgi:hypothetical protein
LAASHDPTWTTSTGLSKGEADAARQTSWLSRRISEQGWQASFNVAAAASPEPEVCRVDT